ncbi:MAG: CvpA family protein [Rubrivivax sp.]|jgi:membrane protein required for colicin V production
MDLPWIDWTLLAVLVVSVAVGVWRGFVFEMLSLLGWLVAWFGAQWWAPSLGAHLPIGSPGSSLNHAAAFTLAFVGVLFAWALLAKLLKLLLHATPLSLPDRALGAGFGLLRGVVLLLAVATVVALTPAVQSEAWRASRGALWLQTAMHGLKPVLPPQVARWLPA